ncbi:hypothetical protein BKA57DRAFT_501283 [Linnemannia elongata]|nr:hypothetical protein BKA57DRAFT_501283 [Linnemannia elongata]
MNQKPSVGFLDSPSQLSMASRFNHHTLTPLNSGVLWTSQTIQQHIAFCIHLTLLALLPRTWTLFMLLTPRREGGMVLGAPATRSSMALPCAKNGTQDYESGPGWLAGFLLLDHLAVVPPNLTRQARLEYGKSLEKFCPWDEYPPLGSYHILILPHLSWLLALNLINSDEAEGVALCKRRHRRHRGLLDFAKWSGCLCTSLD